MINKAKEFLTSQLWIAAENLISVNDLLCFAAMLSAAERYI